MQTTKPQTPPAFDMNILKNGQEKPITSDMIVRVLRKLSATKKPALQVA